MIRKASWNPISANENPQTLSSEKGSFQAVNHEKNVDCGDETKNALDEVIPSFSRQAKFL